MPQVVFHGVNAVATLKLLDPLTQKLGIPCFPRCECRGHIEALLNTADSDIRQMFSTV